MNLIMDKFFVPMKCPCCGETTFIVCNKDGELLDVINSDPCVEYLNEKKKTEKKDS